jgi:anaphase-promoting complex subunit 1
MEFMTLPDLVATRSTPSDRQSRDFDQWFSLTPRTLVFVKFFQSMRDDWSSAQFVEALSSAGMHIHLLETLPEAVLAPLEEAVLKCQTEPPTTWSKDLLAMVGREDVSMLLASGQRPRHMQSTLLVGSLYQSLRIVPLIAHRLHLTSQIWMFTLFACPQQILRQLLLLMDLLKWTGRL